LFSLVLDRHSKFFDSFFYLLMVSTITFFLQFVNLCFVLSYSRRVPIMESRGKVHRIQFGHYSRIRMVSVGTIESEDHFFFSLYATP
jgi:hypothetical protein